MYSDNLIDFPLFLQKRSINSGSIMHQLHRFRRCLLYDNRNPINNWVWSAEAHYQHFAATHFQSVLILAILLICLLFWISQWCEMVGSVHQWHVTIIMMMKNWIRWHDDMIHECLEIKVVKKSFYVKSIKPCWRNCALSLTAIRCLLLTHHGQRVQ